MDKPARTAIVSPEVELPQSLLNSAGFLLNRLARIIREAMTTALEPLGLTPPELGLLRIIFAKGSLTQQALSKLHQIDRTTMVHLLDDLEERGLVIRITKADDRRSHLLYLTPKGKKVLVRASKVAKKQQEKFLVPLSSQEWEAVRESLTKLLEHHL